MFDCSVGQPPVGGGDKLQAHPRQARVRQLIPLALVVSLGGAALLGVISRRARAIALLELGLYTVVRWNNFMTNPPLSITDAELKEGFAIIDQALAVVDEVYEG